VQDTVDVKVLSLVGAQRVLGAALTSAEADDLHMCIVICDPSGLTIVSARMEGAPGLALDIAADKAFTVASFGGMPTDRWWDAIKETPALVHGITHTPRLTLFGGGLPLCSTGMWSERSARRAARPIRTVRSPLPASPRSRRCRVTSQRGVRGNETKRVSV
jgi:glc operon protein GlcG